MATAQTKETTYIGISKPRVDVREKVTGAAIFTDDIPFGAGLLHARVKRSPYPHALIKSIDISKAKELPGVKVVVTGQDFPYFTGLYLKDRNIFARDRVRFVGEAVAGVAAGPDRGRIRRAAGGVRRGPRRPARRPAAAPKIGRI